MSTRETQFAGFAKLLLKEMLAQTQWNGMDFNSDDTEEVEKYSAIIAQRAYDLVEHALEMCHIDERVYDLIRSRDTSVVNVRIEDYIEGYLKRSEMLADIADLTVWPEPPAPPKDPLDEMRYLICSVCGVTYTGPLRDVRGWYGHQTEHQERFAFCGQAHLDQWMTEQGKE